MPKVSTVQVLNVSVSAAQDLFELTPADDKPIKLLGVVVSVYSSETNEQLTCTVQRRSGAYTSGSGGTTPTPVKRHTGDPTIGYSAEANNTTRATGGTQEVYHSEGWPSQGGFAYWPVPGTEPMASQAEAIIVGLEVAPGSATAMNITAVVEELP